MIYRSFCTLDTDKVQTQRDRGAPWNFDLVRKALEEEEVFD